MFASRVFGGKSWLVLLSYQMFHLDYYGQATGLLAAGLAMMTWGIANKRWLAAGIGFTLAASKLHTGFLLAILIILVLPVTWRGRIKILAVPFFIGLLSVIGYGSWPLDLLVRLQNHPANADASISLWRWIGPAALLLLLPPLIVRRPWAVKLVGVAAALPLALPYFQQADLLLYFIFPLGWLPLIGNLGYLIYWQGWEALQMLVIFPVILYLIVLVRLFPGTKLQGNQE